MAAAMTVAATATRAMVRAIHKISAIEDFPQPFGFRVIQANALIRLPFFDAGADKRIIGDPLCGLVVVAGEETIMPHAVVGAGDKPGFDEHRNAGRDEAFQARGVAVDHISRQIALLTGESGQFVQADVYV